MMSFKSKIIEVRYVIITFISLLVIATVVVMEPVAQDINYHQFIDQRTIFTLSNFWNVISNILFLLVGLAGLYSIIQSHRIQLITEMKIAYIIFFFAISLVSFGSAYYHLSPDNATLVWDRLPMTVAFMALFSIIIGEFISCRIGKRVFWFLIVFGVFSIYYWNYTESNGEGDLRLYILVQFLPLLLIPLILLLFKSKFSHTSGYWFLLCAYLFSKILEHFDVVIYENFIFLSGHSIKHIVAALGICFLLKSYHNRKAIELD